MAPEWLIQLLWFVTSSFAVGAFFYYIGNKNKRRATYSLCIAVAVALFTVFLMVRNERSAPSARSTNPLLVNYHTSLLLKYPGPIIYVYKSGLGNLIAPIGYAVVVEVTNNRPTPTKIRSYYLDAGIGGQWVRLPNLGLLNPLDVFWVNNSDLRNCTRLDFRGNGFDPQARQKTIASGESLKGWMFFEWPPELRGGIPSFNKIRIVIENTQGETVNAVLDTVNIQDPGVSTLGGGELIVLPKTEDVDLSQLKIMPFVDLLIGFKEGTSQ